MATYPRWRALGRHVKKGEKAITLCMPITVKRKQAEVVPETTTDEPRDVMTWFVCKPRWFVLSQTDGDPIPAPEIPDWNAGQALTGLEVQEILFDHVDGNCLGFARDRVIAINPVNPLPPKTRFHELAHVLLGHTAEGRQADSVRPKPWHSSAVRRWSCPGSTSAAGISRAGGARATRSPSDRPSGS